MNAEIKGTTMPVLEMSLEVNEAVISTHGELSWMTPNMQMSQTTSSGDATKGHGIMSSLKRMVGGGGLFLTKYQATGGSGTVAFAAKLPGRILPVEIANGNGYLVHRHGWICGTPGITPSIGLQQSFRAGIYGRDGFMMQRLEGQGTAWVELSGEIIQYSLAPGQSLLVHPGHVGMFQDSVQFQITTVPGLSNIAFGGDGYHLVALTGPGDIWLQSMTMPILAQALEPYLNAGNTQAAAQGGVVGGLAGEIFGKSV
ncbi:MAG: AIM24 family protein [Acidimicrobiales bacterium]